MAARLGEHYPVLYKGPAGTCAHEFMLDLRQLADKTGIDPEDIAKRLIDYGFHSPTMSWPVANTLMIEPTESESKVCCMGSRGCALLPARQHGMHAMPFLNRSMPVSHKGRC